MLDFASVYKIKNPIFFAEDIMKFFDTIFSLLFSLLKKIGELLLGIVYYLLILFFFAAIFGLYQYISNNKSIDKQIERSEKNDSILVHKIIENNFPLESTLKYRVDYILKDYNSTIRVGRYRNVNVNTYRILQPGDYMSTWNEEVRRAGKYSSFVKCNAYVTGKSYTEAYFYVDSKAKKIEIPKRVYEIAKAETAVITDEYLYDAVINNNIYAAKKALSSQIPLDLNKLYQVSDQEQLSLLMISNNNDITNLLLNDTSIDINLVNQNMESALSLAIGQLNRIPENNDINKHKINLLLNKSNLDVNIGSPLVKAARSGEIEIVSKLLECKDIIIPPTIIVDMLGYINSSFYRYGLTDELKKLQIAQCEIMKLLFEKDSLDVNLEVKNIRALQLAVSTDNYYVTELLLLQPDIDVNSDGGNPELFMNNYSDDGKRRELTIGFNIHPPLTLAKDTNIAKLLLNHPQIDLSISDYLNSAMTDDNKEIFKLLISHPSTDINSEFNLRWLNNLLQQIEPKNSLKKTQEKRTILHEAVKINKPLFVEILLDHPKISKKSIESALVLAEKEKYLPIIKMLRSHLGLIHKVNVPEPFIKRKISESIFATPDEKLTNFDLETITSLNLDNSQNFPTTFNLEGLEWCKNLQQLTISDYVSDLKPLENLSKLKKLSFRMGKSLYRDNSTNVKIVRKLREQGCLVDIHFNDDF